MEKIQTELLRLIVVVLDEESDQLRRELEKGRRSSVIYTEDVIAILERVALRIANKVKQQCN